MSRLIHQGFAPRQSACLILPDSADKGWADFKEKLTRLDGIVTDNFIDGSDPVLQIRAEDGRNWTVELGTHSQNNAAGLTAAAAMPDDRVSITGRRSRNFGEHRIKALRLVIGDRAFDLFPDSIR